jgi:hypothetical protein
VVVWADRRPLEPAELRIEGINALAAGYSRHARQLLLPRLLEHCEVERHPHLYEPLSRAHLYEIAKRRGIASTITIGSMATIGKAG